MLELGCGEHPLQLLQQRRALAAPIDARVTTTALGSLLKRLSTCTSRAPGFFFSHAFIAGSNVAATSTRPKPSSATACEWFAANTTSPRSCSFTPCRSSHHTGAR